MTQRDGESTSDSRLQQQLRAMLEGTSGDRRPLVGLAASVCQEPEALPKLKSVRSLPI